MGGGRIGGALARLALLLVSLLLVLAVLEVAVRLVWDGFYLKQPYGYAVPNATRGWSNKPSYAFVWGTEEFVKPVSQNSRGFRGPELPARVPPGHYRVLGLGDSFTYGVGVEDAETFGARLEALDPRIEFVNAGVAGYSTAQELLFLREEGLALRPDFVILAFFWNDVVDAYKREVPKFVLVDGRAVFQPARESGPVPAQTERAGDRGIRRYSHAFRFLRDRFTMFRYRLQVWSGQSALAKTGLDPAELDPAWALTRALLEEIRRETASAGVPLALLLIPDQVEVEPGISALGIDETVTEIRHRLLTYAAQTGLPVIDPLDSLRAERARSGEPLYYLKDRHLRARGHEILASSIHDGLARLGFPPGAS